MLLTGALNQWDHIGGSHPCGYISEVLTPLGFLTHAELTIFLTPYLSELIHHPYHSCCIAASPYRSKQSPSSPIAAPYLSMRSSISPYTAPYHSTTSTYLLISPLTLSLHNTNPYHSTITILITLQPYASPPYHSTTIHRLHTIATPYLSTWYDPYNICSAPSVS